MKAFYKRFSIFTIWVLYFIDFWTHILLSILQHFDNLTGNFPSVLLFQTVGLGLTKLTYTFFCCSIWIANWTLMKQSFHIGESQLGILLLQRNILSNVNGIVKKILSFFSFFSFCLWNTGLETEFKKHFLNPSSPTPKIPPKINGLSTV